MKPQEKTPTPYAQLQRALLDAGANRLAVIAGPNAGQKHGSELEFWNVPDPKPGRLAIVQRWSGGEAGERGCWDAYVQISESRTEPAIAEVLGKAPAFIRQATIEEQADIFAAYAEYSGEAVQELHGQRVYIAPSYITACPGYRGPVALIHWDGAPEFVSVLTFEQAGAGYAWRVITDGAPRYAHQLAGAERRAAMLSGALAGLFEHCTMIHSRWGEGSNQREADAAIATARELLAGVAVNPQAVYIVERDSADGPELDTFTDHALALEWAQHIGGTVREENAIDRATLNAMKATRAAA